MALYKVMCLVAVLTLLIRVRGIASFSPRIVGGQVAPEGAWPWQASVNMPTSLCGGSLINNRWVLSAAHCFNGTTANQVTVFLGRQRQRGLNPNEVSRTVLRIINHPNFNLTTGDNDIALLMLSAPVTFTDFIAPILLAAPTSTVHTGVIATVTGWGATSEGGPPSNELMEVQVPIVGNRQCSCDLGGQVTDNMLCAGVSAGGRDACQGDSGGPLMSIQGNLWIQLGVVSLGRGCARPQTPGVYTRVSRYMSWINNQITTNQPSYVLFRSSGTDSDLSFTCVLRPSPSSTTTPLTTTTTMAPTTTQANPTTPAPTTTTATTASTTDTTASNTVTAASNTATTASNTVTAASNTVTTASNTVTTASNTVTTVSTRATTTIATATTATTTAPPSSTVTTTINTATTLSTTATTLSTTPTTPNTVVCGQAPRNSRILGGGSVSSAGIWPWMASLQNNGSHMCGGTLVAMDAVMSSADCFSSSPVASEWTVVLGRLNQNGANPFEVSLNVTSITLSNLSGSNIAVLRLSSQPTLSDYIQPICLDNGQTFSVGSTCWAAGWNSARGGNEQALQEIQTSVVDCGNTSTSENICTSNFTLEQGDFGGPLMCKLDRSWFQAAVLTNGTTSTRQTRVNTTMVFFRVSRYEAFLNRTLGELLSPASNTSVTASANPTFSPVFFHLLVLATSLQLLIQL